MALHYYLIDAFSQTPFSGNPAAVMILEKPLGETTMQAIASELNISETAFVETVDKNAGHYAIRWFSPAQEVELCGHATLAAAHVLYRHLDVNTTPLVFDSASGPLRAALRDDGRIELDFPVTPHSTISAPPLLTQALGAEPDEVLASPTRLLAVFSSSAQISTLTPDMRLLSSLPQYGICCTSVGDGDYQAYDFICRFFAPAAGIPEDPVTGSAYTALAPYFAEKLGKQVFSARQISKRGGNLAVSLLGDRVAIAGFAVTVADGAFLVDS